MSIRVQLPQNLEHLTADAVPLRCPFCGNNGSFSPVGIHDLLGSGPTVTYQAGLRRCPNPSCAGVVFVLIPHGQGLAVVSYPIATEPFDSSRVPEEVAKCVLEMLECHANQCYIASAIMVRRVLELICADKGVGGNSLKERIIDLGNKIVVPKELITAMDDLRLLGNDAAHVEAKAFQQVSETELAIAIELTKEILKAVYQYAGLLDKLKALKKPDAT